MKIIRKPDDITESRCIITTSLSLLKAENANFLCKALSLQTFHQRWIKERDDRRMVVLALTSDECSELNGRFGSRPSFFADATATVRPGDTVYLLQGKQLDPMQRALQDRRRRTQPELWASSDAYEVFLQEFDPIDG